MKRLFVGLGVVFLILLTLVVGLVAYTFYTGPRFDSSSKAFVDEAVPKIVSTWSPEELKRRAAPQLLENATSEQFTRLFAKLSAFGALVRYDGSSGESNIEITINRGRIVTARYVCTASFEHGDARVSVVLWLDPDGHWLISGFHVESV